MSVEWGPNWDEGLAGPETAPDDPNLGGLQDEVKMAYEQVPAFFRHVSASTA